MYAAQFAVMGPGALNRLLAAAEAIGQAARAVDMDLGLRQRLLVLQACVG